MRCGADNATRRAKIMFEELGMLETISKVEEYLSQDFTAAEEDQVDVHELVLIEKQPTAYLLRRNFATHMAILQLTEAELTYILGHVIVDPQIQRSDFTNERLLYAIKQKMDKRPIVNDISMVPPWILEANSTKRSSEHRQEYRLKCTHTSSAKLHATAKEPGDSITITVEQSAGVTTRETVSLLGSPYPEHFPRNTDVLKAYHAAYLKEDTES
jgi:hypothetical protein